MDRVLYAGAYTGGVPGNGMRVLSFDGTRLREEKALGPAVNPSYVLPEQGLLYGAEEVKGSASVAVFSVASGEGRRFEIPGSGICHLTACGPYLYASGYAGGCLTGLRKSDGKVVCFLEHTGSGAHPVRQDRPHVHSAQPSPDGKRLFVADLGTDRLFQYDIGEDGGLTPHAAQPWVQTAPSQGPRHFAFHPNGEWLYLVTELDSSLLVYRYDREASLLEYRGERSLRVEHCPPGALAADIHLTEDGAFLYASVRGSDRLFCFRVTEGMPEYAGDFPCGGNGPRSFDLCPDGSCLAVANQVSGNVAVLPLDRETGAVGAPTAAFALPEASCVKWEREA